MASITAELLPDSAAVRLSINAVAGIRSITRADANGVNDVRTGEGVLDVVPDLAFAGTNLVTNPSCETDINGWVAFRATISRYSFQNSPNWKNYSPPAGNFGLLVQTDGTATAAPLARIDLGTVTPGDFIAVAGNSSNGAGSRSSVGISFYTAAGAYISEVFATPPPVASVYNLQRSAVTAVVPPTAGKAYFNFRAYNEYATGFPTVPSWTYCDRAIAVTGTSLEDADFRASSYFDGSYSPSMEYKTAWTGTAHASTSTRMVPVTPVVVTDYEAGSGPLRYDVVDGNGTLESLEVSGFALDAPWLFTPVIPGFSRKAVAVTGVDTSFEDLSTIHSGLLGRPDPVVVMRPLGMRSGTLEIYAGTYADALDILSPLTRATVMMLRQPEHAGMDMYFAPAGGSPQIINLTTAAGATVWGVKVPYVEVKRPEGPLAGALGWTYADLTAAVPRYADLPRTFASYADMRLNKRKTP